jgi:hypothetical protein
MRWHRLLAVGIFVATAVAVARDSGAAGGCVDGTAVIDGTDGAISAGQLRPNAAYWRQPQGTKLWVGSTRPQPPTSAFIEVRRLDGHADAIRTERGPDQLGEVTGLALFYPGTLRIPEPGRWQITVRIGPDDGCFVVEVD